MLSEHLVLCGSARLTSPKQAWQAATPLQLQLGKKPRHVHLRIDHITRQMCAGLPDIAVDLVEVAALVYAADQVITRGGTQEFEYGHRWRRRFRFEIPVRCPGVWLRPEVTDTLTRTLSFLSDDDYEFGFSQLKNPQPMTRYLFDESGGEGAEGFEQVLLFSGGVDSLGEKD